MSHTNSTRLTPAVRAARSGRRRLLCRPGLRRRRPGADREGRVEFQRLLHEAFDQYVFTRVDHILRLAGTNDAGYRKTAAEVSAALDRLLALARALKDQQPEMTGLVMDFEAWAALESGQAAEIAYRQGLRDSSQVRQAFMALLPPMDA
ncbi:hypothetical protein [Sporomusa termitida]|uniref:Uncharacterized protein n=1 Tax=Sporomusa termitida TaxID=2377 RepID=A0A517DUY8_9FIRM|nr:hypothetical protein [Sporomusa termitida]QDR81147.1 hypothetical protein SPTER_25200 [Sporomusa termitida]